MSENTSEQEIRECAYEIYLARGDQDGDEVSDWIAAECEHGVSFSFLTGFRTAQLGYFQLLRLSPARNKGVR